MKCYLLKHRIHNASIETEKKIQISLIFPPKFEFPANFPLQKFKFHSFSRLKLFNPSKIHSFPAEKQYGNSNLIGFPAKIFEFFAPKISKTFGAKILNKWKGICENDLNVTAWSRIELFSVFQRF